MVMTNISAATTSMGLAQATRGSDPGLSVTRARFVGRSPARRFAQFARFGLAAGCALALSACVTPQEQRAMDKGQCYDFGFEPGSEGFAECMMGLHQQRADIQASRSMQLQAQLAEQSYRRDMQQDRYKALSLQRSGDKTFPICGASSDGGMDRRTMTWFGPNCRAR